jgi:hypothetical protein
MAPLAKPRCILRALIILSSEVELEEYQICTVFVAITEPKISRIVKSYSPDLMKIEIVEVLCAAKYGLIDIKDLPCLCLPS